MTAPAAARYQELDVLSMSPGARLLLLYRHLEGNLRLGLRALEEGDVERRTVRLGKASDIVGELLGSLDLAQGGEVASRLAAIYAWILAELPTVLSPTDAGRLVQILEMVSELQSAWTTVVAQAEGGEGSPGASATLRQGTL